MSEEAPQIAPVAESVETPVETVSQPIESEEAPVEALADPVESATPASAAQAAGEECIEVGGVAEPLAAAAVELSVSEKASQIALLAESAETPGEAISEPVESVASTSPVQSAADILAEPLAAAVELSASEESQIAPIGESVPAEAVAEPVESTTHAPLAQSVEVECVNGTAESSAESPPIVESAETPAEAPPEPAEVAATEVLSEPVGEPLAVAPATPSASEGTPPAESLESAPADSPIPLAEETALAAAELAQALELDAETLLEAIARQVEARDAGVRAVAATFSDRPKTSLLAAPSEIVQAPAPLDLQCIRTTRPFILASEPGDPDRSALTSGPLTSTLAGPCLPRELVTFVEQPPVAQKRLRKSAPMPTWIISLVVATALFLGAGSLLQYLTSAKETKGAVPPTQPAAQSVAAASDAPSAETHPFARFVEVTGLRVIADSSHKPQVQYLVVNHSSSHISGVVLKIVVTPAEPSGAAALFTLSSVIPSLGPYQSKEIRTDLDAELRPSSIPDWQYLHTDVQIGSQQ